LGVPASSGTDEQHSEPACYGGGVLDGGLLALWR
jgi:hypothetical protein